MRTFYCSNIPKIGDYFQLEKRDAKHLFKTLRARIGDVIEVLDGQGKIGLAQIEKNEQLSLQSLQVFTPPRCKIHLAVAVPRRQKMDQLMTQCTELGIWSLTPLLAERSVSIVDKTPDDERWLSLLIEGCKQSQNPFMPKLNPVQKLSDFISAHNWDKELGFVGVPRKAPTLLTSVETENIYWIVGPEGGFSLQEEQLMFDAKIKPLTLATCVLRVETAAIVGSALLKQVATTQSFYEFSQDLK